MKTRRLKNVLVTYFTCTRAEKHAAILLGVILLVLQAYLFIVHHEVPPKAIPVQKSEQFAIRAIERPGESNAFGSHSSRRVDFKSLKIGPFDPNSLDENGFVRLGMSSRQASSLLRFRDRIGGFRSKEDVKRVRVLDSALYACWAPFIQLPERELRSDKSGVKFHVSRPEDRFEGRPLKQKNRMLIDLNEADSILLKELPWIGSGRARAISNYRDRLGGFVAIEQLLEIRAIPDSVYMHILPYLTLKSGPYRRLEINRMPVDSLRHPYLGKQFARMIVSYRDQHGSYTSVNDLLKLPLADEEILRKLAPYLIF